MLPQKTDSQQPIQIMEYLRIILKRLWLIILIFVVVVTAVALSTFRMEPIYLAVTTIMIERDIPQQIVKIQDVVAPDTAADYYQTQYRILQSESLIRRVVERLTLKYDPEFNRPAQPSYNPLNYLRGRLISLFTHKTTPKTAPESLPDKPQSKTIPTVTNDPDDSYLVGRFHSSLRIMPQANTRLVAIGYESTSPALAARLVNSLAETYILMSMENKFSVSDEASNWLKEQLQDLKGKVEESERAIYDFMASEQIVSVPTLEKAERINENIVGQRLGELNSEVSKAKSERIGLETMLKEHLALSQKPEMIDASPAAMTNGYLQNLKSEYFRLQVGYLLLAEKYGPMHPKIIQINSQLEEMKNKMTLELTKLTRSLEAQYRVALAKEEAFVAALEEQKLEALDLNKKVIRYGMLKREVDTNKQLYDNFLLRMKETAVTSNLKSSNIRIIDPARVPKSPIKPDVMKNLTMAALFSLALGFGLTFFLESLENTLRTPEDIEKNFKVPSLGVITTFAQNQSDAKNQELITISDSRSNASEAFRNLRTNVLYSSYDPPRKILLVTSSVPQEGKTLVCANLAVIMAMAGKKVLLVDADMRRPRLHKIFGSERESGLSQYLIGEAEEEQIIRESEVANLSLVLCGDIPPNPSELLGSERMKTFLSSVREKFDYVLLDSPPIISVTDALVMGGQANGIIMIIKARSTKREQVRRSLKQIDDVNIKILGFVLNQLDLKKEGYYYHYYYRYHYYQQSDKKHSSGKRHRKTAIKS